MATSEEPLYTEEQIPPPPPTCTIPSADALAIEATVAEVEEHVKQAVESMVVEDQHDDLSEPLVRDDTAAPRVLRWRDDDKVASMHEINQSLPPEVHLSKTPLVDSISEGLGACGALLLVPLLLVSILPVGVASYCVFGL